MRFAPVVVFAYRRPALTRQMLRSLLSNPEVADTRVYAFCDGPREPADVPAVEEVRAAVRGAGIGDLRLVEREQNLGLARSVIDGVTRVCEEHGSAIVLEDDLELSPRFLAYMNAALERYRDVDRVFHVSGYTYPVDLAARTDAVFLPFIGSWGWATWHRAWKQFDPTAGGYSKVAGSPLLRRRFDLGGAYGYSAMLERQLRGEIDSWAIRWYLTVFVNDGLALYPARSLVRYAGIGAEATHSWARERLHDAAAHDFEVRDFPPPDIDRRAYHRIRRFLGRETGVVSRARRRLLRMLESIAARRA
jgi:hypothetical protein